MWRSSKEEWERRKTYLIRSLFEDLPVLSPIYESQEPTPSSSYDDVYRPESPLPDLIIEKEPPKYQQDESEEFYKKLAKEMRRLYRRDFLNIANSTSTSADTSYEIAEENYIQKYTFDRESRSLEAEQSVHEENIEDEEHLQQITEEENEEETRSSSTYRESTESEEICRYEQITTKADVHTDPVTILERSFDERVHRSEEKESRSVTTEMTERSFSSEENEQSHGGVVNEVETGHEIENEQEVEIGHEVEIGQEAEIEQEESKELAKPIEASSESSVPMSPDEHIQLTPEIMRRRQTIFFEDSLPYHELPICESNDKVISDSVGMDIENTMLSENIQAVEHAAVSGYEMELADTSLTDLNVFFTVTSTPKSSKKISRSRIIKRYKSSLVPYSFSSSSVSKDSRRQVALQTSFSDEEPDWNDLWRNFFVGIPTVYNICSCKNHVCS